MNLSSANQILTFTFLIQNVKADYHWIQLIFVSTIYIQHFLNKKKIFQNDNLTRDDKLSFNFK